MSNYKVLTWWPAMLSGLMLLASCKEDIRTASDLQAYINQPENRLLVSEAAGKVETSMAYKPWQIIGKKSQAAKKADKQTLAVSDLKKKLFFVLSLSANHKELLKQLKFSDYSEMVQVLAFRMSEYIEAVPDDGKAVTPEECLFQQTYGLGSANQVLVVFNKPELEKAKEIEIKVKEFGLHTGDLHYRFNLQDINALNNIPPLN